MKRMFVTVAASILTIAGLSNAVRANSIDQTPWSNLPVIDHESDPIVEERNLKHEFRGTNLTAQQFEQIRKARRQLRTDLTQLMRNDLGQILQLVFLPKAEADQQSVNLFKNPLTNYAQALSSVLTPEQLKIWQRNTEQFSKK